MPQRDEASKRALAAKMAVRSDVRAAPHEPMTTLEAKGIFIPGYDDFATGLFQLLDHIRLRWVAADYFEFIPKAAGAFRFVRSTGEAIEPRRMFTDGGTIPRLLWPVETLSPWGFAPAYLVHDWEFDSHHCKTTTKSFEAVRDTMMEAVKTLMETGVCDRSDLTFRAIYLGISSPIARKLWDKQPPACPLPPDHAE
jgi:hypothetical protein